MAGLLHLFIQPPYDAGPDGPWSQEYGYGTISTATGPADVRDHAFLRTSGNGKLFAAIDGLLSIRPPAGGWLDPLEEIVIPDVAKPLPIAVNLYLRIDLFTMLNPAFQAFQLRARQINSIIGFEYLNVEVASLESHLAELLDAVVIPVSDEKRPSPEQIVDRFVRGELDVRVSAGHAIGTASGSGGNPRQVGFTVLTSLGPLDPAHTYDWMRYFVDDGQQALHDLLAVMPQSWPVISPNLAVNDAINLTADALYPNPVLLELKTKPGLTPANWRQIGDNQKKLWRNRLLVRTSRTAPAPSNDPPFEFNDRDWQNIFQLEAIVEYFANYDDPWATNSNPVQPDSPLQGTSATVVAGNVVALDGNPDLKQVRLNHDTIYLELDKARSSRTYRVMAINDTTKQVTLDASPNLGGSQSTWRLNLYTVVNLLDPAGTAAQAASSTVDINDIIDVNLAGKTDITLAVTLDGVDDLTRIRVGKDILFLENSAGRASRQYRITGLSIRHRTVAVDIDPQIPADASSAWQIYLRPTLVIIDGFGGRLKGYNATALEGAGNILRLDNLPKPRSKINGRFDTIYLPNDSARSSRTYRILKVDDANNTVTLDGNPFLLSGSSLWHIPAGVSGELTVSHNLGPDTARAGGPLQYDHYDGALFVIYNNTLGEVPLPWTTYTSHTNPAGDNANIRAIDKNSSLRGNRRYDYHSRRSPGSANRNYAFAVKDPDATYDGVREARRYYENPVVPDRAGPTAPPAYPGLGKTNLLLHYSNPGSNGNQRSGSGSAGCLVSPDFYSLRDVLVEIYQNEHIALALNGTRDDEVQKVLGLRNEKSKQLWTANQLTDTNWDGKLCGTLWVIRPDEPPLP